MQDLRDIRDLLRSEYPEIDAIPAEQMANRVEKLIAEMKKPGVRPEDFSGTVRRVLEEARAQEAKLKFADAAQLLAKALAETETGRVALLAESGRIARLRWRYREAAEFYAKAAEAAFGPR